MISSLPWVVSAILTTATILTLNDQVHEVLSDTSVFGSALADVPTLVFVASVVEDQSAFAIFSEWRKAFIFALPFVLQMVKLNKNVKICSQKYFQMFVIDLLSRICHVGCHLNMSETPCHLRKLPLCVHMAVNLPLLVRLLIKHFRYKNKFQKTFH